MSSKVSAGRCSSSVILVVVAFGVIVVPFVFLFCPCRMFLVVVWFVVVVGGVVGYCSIV